MIMKQGSDQSEVWNIHSCTAVQREQQQLGRPRLVYRFGRSSDYRHICWLYSSTSINSSFLQTRQKQKCSSRSLTCRLPGLPVYQTFAWRVPSRGAAPRQTPSWRFLSPSWRLRSSFFVPDKIHKVRYVRIRVRKIWDTAAGTPLYYCCTSAVLVLYQYMAESARVRRGGK